MEILLNNLKELGGTAIVAILALWAVIQSYEIIMKLIMRRNGKKDISETMLEIRRNDLTHIRESLDNIKSELKELNIGQVKMIEILSEIKGKLS